MGRGPGGGPACPDLWVAVRSLHRTLASRGSCKTCGRRRLPGTTACFGRSAFLSGRLLPVEGLPGRCAFGWQLHAATGRRRPGRLRRRARRLASRTSAPSTGGTSHVPAGRRSSAWRRCGIEHPCRRSGRGALLLARCAAPSDAPFPCAWPSPARSGCAWASTSGPERSIDWAWAAPEKRRAAATRLACVGRAIEWFPRGYGRWSRTAGWRGRVEQRSPPKSSLEFGAQRRRRQVFARVSWPGPLRSGRRTSRNVYQTSDSVETHSRYCARLRTRHGSR